MAVYLIGCDAVCFHIPKTAIHWVEQTLRENGIPVRLATASGKVHQKLALPVYINDPGLKNLKYRFCFVRHPKAWYESWFGFCTTPADKLDRIVFPPTVKNSIQIKVREEISSPLDAKNNPWDPTNVLPPNSHHPEFNEWVEACIQYQSGFVTRMYEWYIGPPGLPSMTMDFVGRFELLADHLSAILKRIGISISADQLASVPSVNTSHSNRNIDWNQDTLEKMLDRESSCIRRFYDGNENELKPQ